MMITHSITASFQRGIVLFVALIALLVLSLAAVALIRSVDTNTIIAGNLALRQTALIATDRGAESAITWMENTLATNATVLNGHDSAQGYFATYVAKCDGAEDPLSDEIDAIYMVDNCGVLSTADDGLGNEIRYIVQRMCYDSAKTLPYEADEASCMLGEAEIGTGSFAVKDASEAGMQLDAKQSPVYRVTVKVTGPKNTVSYAQTFVY